MVRCIASLALLLAAGAIVHAQASEPPQVPLCMIGDSITWAQEGDYWRQYLIEQIPTLAFVGTHTATLGYSHAGEGGNSTSAVLARLEAIPACPNYHLLIGTNDGRSKDEAQQQVLAQGCADRIVKIVQGLLAKPGTQKVFLGSILPCYLPEMPERDQTNGKVNAILRPQISTLFPDGRVVWVEYEQPIRAIRNWGPIIQLHPTRTGYRLIATILAQTLRDELKLGDAIPAPKPAAGAGVRVTNLWGDGKTSEPIIAGWYTMSFDVKAAEPGASITLTGEGKDAKSTAVLKFDIPADCAGKRVTWNLMTGYAGYGYTNGVLTLSTDKCSIDRILFEKKRPSSAASVYGTGSYIDTTSPISLGELLER
jgi:lysophospholipase L1-like esterase